jgi:hypothetical protein
VLGHVYRARDPALTRNLPPRGTSKATSALPPGFTVPIGSSVVSAPDLPTIVTRASCGNGSTFVAVNFTVVAHAVEVAVIRATRKRSS